MNINDVLKSKHKARKRIGRGPGSGQGKTAGKGHKGQKARSGASIPLTFEGGQMPLYRRIPKRGFTNAPFKTVYTPVNLYRLNGFKKGDTVSEETLREKGIISGKNVKVKILGKGDLEVALKIDVPAVSEKAREKIVAQGGEIVESKSS
jgi:large subunit ribosomal protein L15